MVTSVFKISCSKHLVRASKFIIGQFHIAASRNNSTFNIQKSKLRSAPPCAKKYSCHSRNSCSKKFMVTSVFKISCSKHLVRASKFIIGQFHIAASRNNSTFNIQKSKLRSAPPCAKKIFVSSALLPPFGQWAYGESRVQKNIQRAMP